LEESSVSCADPSLPPSPPATAPARREALHAGLVWTARAGVLAHAAFVPLSVAGMQIGLGVTVAALVGLRLAGVRVWSRSPVDLPALLFVGAALASIALAAAAGSPPAGWHGATLWRSFLSPIVIVSALALELPGEDRGATRRRAMAALLVWAAAALVPSLLAWVQFKTGIDPLYAIGLRSTPRAAAAPRYPGHFAAIGFFWWYTVFGQNLTPPLALAAGVALHGRLPPRRRAFLAFASVAIALAVALTFSRAAWVALAAAAVVLVLLGGQAFARKALPVTLAAFAVIAVAQPGLRNRLLHSLAPNENADRLSVWTVCAAVLKDWPVTGIGWGNLHARVSEYYDRLAPWAGVRAGCHNIFYTALVEGGPLLLVAAFLYWALLFRGFWRARRDGDALARAAAAGAIAGGLGLLLNGLWHDVFYSSEPMYGLGLALGLAAALARVPREAASRAG
jgi:O-antigen ligase